jgi:hypothetical protein
MSDLDNLLDATLDDLEDLPEFKPFAAGAHSVKASFEGKDVGGKSCIELSFVMIEVLELADPATPEKDIPKEGDQSSTLFFLDNEYGRGNLKKCAAPFAEALNLTSIRDVVEQVKDVECALISTITTDKHDVTKQYLNVKEIQVT